MIRKLQRTRRLVTQFHAAWETLGLAMSGAQAQPDADAMTAVAIAWLALEQAKSDIFDALGWHVFVSSRRVRPSDN